MRECQTPQVIQLLQMTETGGVDMLPTGRKQARLDLLEQAGRGQVQAAAKVSLNLGRALQSSVSQHIPTTNTAC